MKKNKEQLLPIIVFMIGMFIIIVFLIACQFLENDKKEQAEKQKEYIQELEEKVEYYETELKRLYSEQDLDYESYSVYWWLEEKWRTRWLYQL